MPNKPMERRDFIKAAAASLVIMQSYPLSALSLIKGTNSKKLVWIMLRGALDPLHTVVPVGDKHLDTHRANLVEPIKDSLLPLDSMFSLHPNLSFLYELYQQRQLTPVIAVATAYRDRSHFDAQDQMESGLDITQHENGWLARALDQYQGNGVAVARTIPIALRGSKQEINTWYPSTFAQADTDTMARLAQMYEDDPELSKTLTQAIQQIENPNMQMQNKRRPNFVYLAQRCAELLHNESTVNCGMLEMGGWDTHNNMASRLARQFDQLNLGLQQLKTTLADTWQDTLIIITSEFGRTVRVNGTGGSDHGTGGVMFFSGGALKNISALSGGSVLGAWPGLAEDQLYENRDLMPTSDIRQWIATALSQHWQLTPYQIKKVFPDIVIN